MLIATGGLLSEASYQNQALVGDVCGINMGQWTSLLCIIL
jgi:hypothetical protein